MRKRSQVDAALVAIPAAVARDRGVAMRADIHHASGSRWTLNRAESRLSRNQGNGRG
ncbi:MAG: hypothetical protein L0220_05310 [Acidobacteria bacterium]|nr:hypothetical protein [Acidobacteriota bacterium]